MTDFYKWEIRLDFAPDAAQGGVSECVQRLHSAILHTLEQTLSESLDGCVAVQLASGAAETIEQTMSIRKTFQIKEVARKVGDVAYSTAEAAIDAMRSWRERADRDKDAFVIVKDVDGMFYVAREGWSSCEFDSQIEAEDAMQAFEDPTLYQITPVLVFDSTTLRD